VSGGRRGIRLVLKVPRDSRAGVTKAEEGHGGGEAAVKEKKKEELQVGRWARASNTKKKLAGATVKEAWEGVLGRGGPSPRFKVHRTQWDQR